MSLSVEELDSLINYFKKNNLSYQHLVMQRKIISDQQAKKVQEKKPPKERERERERPSTGGGIITYLTCLFNS